ncbi:MAG TPA: LysM peptidoglycan-binding domain-containing protein, partial [Candidatus Binatia bacterium]|nr:LysM peptidoglycan-binding domain-containing protein [Candidatus Binatia bacterium]
MSYIKPHLSPELRAQITPQSKRDRRMTAAGVFLLAASFALAYNVWPQSDDTATTINNKLESIGAQTDSVSFGNAEKQVLGAATDSAEEAAPAAVQTSQTTTTDEQFTSYTVKDGDTLFNISQSYNVKWDLIAQFNNLPEPYILHAGDKLRIPQATTSTVPGKIYTIVKGDTLASIAKKYNITVADIIAVNP